MIMADIRRPGSPRLSPERRFNALGAKKAARRRAQ
jgi:hypothetical protein